MKILIAPDKFKGSLTALEVSQAIERGIKRYDASIETILMPLADGGDGSVDIIAARSDAVSIEVLVKDPLGRSINASYLLDKDKAYIEMAKASGLILLTDTERNPLYTSTFGTGELILDAISHGATKIYILVGGSATNDMGIGMATALGYRFLDRDGDEVPSVGLSLSFIMNIKKELRFDKDRIQFYAVCDVDNLLFGKKGAAYVYGAQKGANKYAIQILDKGLRKLSKRCKRILHKNIAKISGSGAAGGMGAGIMAFLDGKILSGSDFILDISGCDDVVQSVDLVITGEGKFDDQSLQGKIIGSLAKRTRVKNIPLWVIAGQNELSLISANKIGINKIGAIMDHCSDKKMGMSHAAQYIEDIAYKMSKASLGEVSSRDQ